MTEARAIERRTVLARWKETGSEIKPEKNPMTKTFEPAGNVKKTLPLFLRLGALLLLFGIIGCSADKHMVLSGGRAPDPGLSGPGDPQGPASPERAKAAVATTGEPQSVVAGAAGSSHAVVEPGPQGAVASTDSRRRAGVIDSWISYRDFNFDTNQTNLRVSDANKVFEIATYMKANPSLKVGFDGSIEPLNEGLTDRRINTVRDALVDAGVPRSRIQTAAFTDSKSVHDGRVTVLVRTID